MQPIRLATLTLAAALAASPLRSQEADLSNAYSLPGTDIRIRPYGWVQVYGQYYFDQYLYDNGTLIGYEADARNVGSTPDKQFSLSARTSRFGFNAAIPSRFGDVTTSLELGFSAGSPSPRGNPKLNQAWIGLGGWIVGYTWSNWINMDALPETVDSSGPIGQTSFDTGRFTQVRYVWRPVPRHAWSLSVEANQRAFKDWTGDNPNPKKPDGKYEDTIRPDARYPSVVAAYTYRRDWGQVSLRALEQQYGAYRPFTAATEATPATPTAPAVPAAPAVPSTRIAKWGGAVQVSGVCKVGREDKLVYSVYTGEGLGVYGFNPQGIQWGTNLERSCLYRSTGWQAGYTHHWTPRVRSNLIATGLHFRHNAAVVDNDVRRSENYFVNTIVKLTRSVEWGLEYGYEGIRTFGAQAVTQRDGSKSDTNRSSKLQMTLTAKF
jgi:hypothetical protein